ncbi:hypothetical protein EDC04DRAFT_2998995 [Pisolithus marmoratus]|nr:hypothetical protein EDC04DRAFT_2998995 [Pisolithus marmoratus]
MAAMCNVIIPTPPGTVTLPDTDIASAASPPQPLPISNLERLKMAVIPNPPSAALPVSNLERLKMAAIPNPPSATLPISNLERLKMAVIPNPPSAAPALDMDWLEQLHNAMIPHPPSSRIEVTDVQSQPSSLTGDDINQGEEPDHSHTVDFGNPNCGQLWALLLNAIAGDMPTPDEHQALEQAELATSDMDDDFLHMLHTLKSQHGPDFPPLDIPYNKDLDRHIMWAMQQIAANIRHLVRSRVQHVQAGQYMVDMIDLLEVSHYPHVGYNLQQYTRGPPYPSQQSMIEMAILYLGCHIECAVIHLLGMRPSNWPTGWYANLCLDMKELDHLVLVTISWESFSPMLPACFHAYLRCKEDQA